VLVGFFVGLAILMSLAMIIQEVLNIFFKLYSWSTLERFRRANFLADFSSNGHQALPIDGGMVWQNPWANGRKVHFVPPQKTFSILIPARHEKDVIRETIFSAAKINYPKDFFEILVVCEAGDLETITEVERAIADPACQNVRLVTFANQPINKPHALNVGLAQSCKEIVCVFDAEDNISPGILNLANSIIATEEVDVLQAGVQLVDFGSRWFSPLNVLEYYFWFKSRLNFFAKLGVVSLGGNTVFFKSDFLTKVGGWDNFCLTEDAEIGIRLAVAGARIRVVYADKFATQEETPKTMAEFIRQRTRWNQGFLQVLKKGEIFKLATPIQKLAAIYTFVSPLTITVTSIFLPFLLFKLLYLNLPVVVAMFLIFPMYPLIFGMVLNVVGLHEFGQSFDKKIHFKYYLLLFLTFFPYQLMLSAASLRAFWREATSQLNWEKTTHPGFHRVAFEAQFDLPGEEARLT